MYDIFWEIASAFLKIFLIFEFCTFVENFPVKNPNKVGAKTEQSEFTGVIKTEQSGVDFWSFCDLVFPVLLRWGRLIDF